MTCLTSLRTAALFAIIALFAMAQANADEADHWAFKRLRHVEIPQVEQTRLVRTPIDSFIQAKLQRTGLQLRPPAHRDAFLRRLSYGLRGLPANRAEREAFRSDESVDAVPRLIERMLASPRYGERWGKVWLDAAGYADSNGYFNADTDRPLAYKYRDYVIRMANRDAPYDRFVREQLAGDELAEGSASGHVTDRTIDLLTATHFLRNAQDGTSESDGNPDEVTVDRATVLEGTLQIAMNALLGLTIQCARCHDHKFEPIEQVEYYQLQSIFYPAFPFLHRDAWVGPKDRVSHVASPGEMAAWEAADKELDRRVDRLRKEFTAWALANRPPAAMRFHDTFDDAAQKLSAHWSNTAPGDERAGGETPVNLDSEKPPGAKAQNGVLQLFESGGSGNRWLSTKSSMDWTPDKQGEWVQVTFDLVGDKIGDAGTPAARIGYYIALHDYDDSRPTSGGNILVDGNPAGGAAIHLDYPGGDAKAAGEIGRSGYRSGNNYGVRITNVGDGAFRLEHLFNLLPEERSLKLKAADLPDGGFGFEFCCGRSFVVDNVVIEGSGQDSDARDNEARGASTKFWTNYEQRRKDLNDKLKALETKRAAKPGKLAWVTDLMTPPPEVHLLERGVYAEPGSKVTPAGLATLADPENRFEVAASGLSKSSGRRLAFANWLTRRDSRAAALLSRVMVNRIWQHHFGVGLVSTTENLGRSGAEPSHPDLLEFLAGEFVRLNWSTKSMHRLITNSAVYQQAAADDPRGAGIDANNRLLWRFPLRRLDAESIRDGMLAASGELDDRTFGPYVPTKMQGDGNVVVDESHPGARRRSVYLRQRRTQMNSLLSLFDAPAMVSTCGKRSTSTAPLQSLALLNSTFVRNRAAAMARRLERSSNSDGEIIRRAFELVIGRPPTAEETDASVAFLKKQRVVYAAKDETRLRPLADFCQMLFASNAFLYVE